MFDNRQPWESLHHRNEGRGDEDLRGFLGAVGGFLGVVGGAVGFMVAAYLLIKGLARLVG